MTETDLFLETTEPSTFIESTKTTNRDDIQYISQLKYTGSSIIS